MHGGKRDGAKAPVASASFGVDRLVTALTPDKKEQFRQARLQAERVKAENPNLLGRYVSL